ncbi:hypothetical protein Tco_1319303 [Tanacetum coccineum]
MGGRRSKQDIINTVGTMGLKGLETSWNNSTAKVHEGTDEVLEGTAKVHEGTDEVLEGTAQEYESTAGANLSTAEVYESTAHSLFKQIFAIWYDRIRVLLTLLLGSKYLFKYWMRWMIWGDTGFGFLDGFGISNASFKGKCVSYHILKYSFAGYDFKDNLFVLKWCGEDLSKSSKGDLNFVSFKEMITSQLQGKLWLYDEVLLQEMMKRWCRMADINNVDDYNPDQSKDIEEELNEALINKEVFNTLDVDYIMAVQYNMTVVFNSTTELNIGVLSSCSLTVLCSESTT